ncbi:MAG: dTDP-glucose 4,6-dehydratase [Candidatus Marinimicrobia bacterium]|nr:dTDP-glucose 4,6-dehydratase [Candidatus Neomarinimicrobiota bacterium]MCF7850441.1 dTDP-glucose 4,6-dehydratase [Candidatus Neomarinimicrobiota bacterium]MCF7904573.1 dTDP-glucose 4,6-dehydratase [Candidatus Neomarinimicrobiota bacterium]
MAKKIIVTGGAGFIGSNFILKQINETANEILNLDKLTYAGNLDNLASVADHARYQFVEGDITDKELVQSLVQGFQPDGIVHFAAESHVDRSIDGPMPFIMTNVVGTANLLDVTYRYWKDLEVARKADFRFLHVSTDEVFGSLGMDDVFKIDTPYDPSSPYSASKAGSDHLVRAWGRTFDFPVLITNCTNNYGPFQFPEKLIPLVTINALAGKELPIYGTGENIRDWLHVEDHCDAIYSVFRDGKVGDTYLVGGEEEVTNLRVVQTICDVLDEIRPTASGKSYREQITFVADRPGHDLRYAMDISKIRDELGWRPSKDFAAGLKHTIEWYLANEPWWRKLQEKKIYEQQRLGTK